VFHLQGFANIYFLSGYFQMNAFVLTKESDNTHSKHQILKI